MSGGTKDSTEAREYSTSDRNMFFSVALLFHISPIDKPDTPSMWEERILLISADDEDEAKSKAEGMITKEFTYENSYGNTVIYKYACVERVFQIPDDPADGSELFVRFLRDSEARSLLTPFDE